MRSATPVCVRVRAMAEAGGGARLVNSACVPGGLVRAVCSAWAQLAVGGRCGSRCRRGKRGPCERGVTHGCLGEPASGVFAVHRSWSWCTDKRRRSVPTCRRIEEGAALGGITLTRPITRACWPGGGGDDGCTAGGTRGAPSAKTRPPPKACQHGAVAEGGYSVDVFASHETVFCVGGREADQSFSTSPVRFVCGAAVPGERRPPRASAALNFRPRVWPIATVGCSPP